MAKEKKQSKEEKYLIEHKRILSSFVNNGTDTIGNTINKIYAKGDEFVLYSIKESTFKFNIRVFIHTEIKDNREIIDNYNSIKDNFDNVKSILYKTRADDTFFDRCASGLVAGLYGNTDRANEVFQKIKDDAANEYNHKIYGRLYYLLGAFLMMSLLCFTALISYFFRSSDFFSYNHDFLMLIYSIAFSVLGGFFSVSLKIRDMFTLRTISNKFYVVHGAERLIISMISGIITYILISSGLIFANLNGINDIYVILTICFISGFSETLIPNTLNKIENNHHKK